MTSRDRHPGPGSAEPAPLDVITYLADHEPEALHTQLPLVWARAEGTRIHDEDGREWVDWTSGILAANLGHAPAPVVAAVVEAAQAPLLHSYGFATRVRAQAIELLTELTGFPFAVLTTTGTEAAEVAIKLCRSRARANGRARAVVVGFAGAFHGRTAGAQLAGGLPAQQHWTPAAAGEFVHLPYPATPGASSAVDRLDPEDVACVIVEPYQGSTLRALDPAAARNLQTWCHTHDVPLVLDEIQSGFGRTGSLFAHPKLGLAPDMLLVGKGLASGLPVAATLYRSADLTKGIRPGELTTTNGGNPIALAAACATMRMFQDPTALSQVPHIEAALSGLLTAISRRYPPRVATVACHGAVAGFEVRAPAGQPDQAGARRFVARCGQHGLLLLAPVGVDGNLIKLAPPLVTTEAEMRAAVEIALAAAEAELATATYRSAGTLR